MSQMTGTLRELADEVETQDDFARFLARLHEHSLRHPGDWANNDLPSYLEGMSAWVEDMDGYYTNQGIDRSQVPPFRMMAQILLAATVYE